MSNKALKVLHVEDDFADAMLVQHAVCEAGDFNISLEVVRTLKEAKRRLSMEAYDLILLDLRLPDSVQPEDTLAMARSCAEDTPVLILSGSLSIDEDMLPEGVSRLDKNTSFNARGGDLPTQIAHLIRDAAAMSDIQAI